MALSQTTDIQGRCDLLGSLPAGRPRPAAWTQDELVPEALRRTNAYLEAGVGRRPAAGASFTTNALFCSGDRAVLLNRRAKGMR